jgi:hypothetical protein
MFEQVRNILKTHITARRNEDLYDDEIKKVRRALVRMGVLNKVRGSGRGTVLRIDHEKARAYAALFNEVADATEREHSEFKKEIKERRSRFRSPNG